MYDAIIVGARCAGAATAMLLARRGRKVLVVDRERFPSDKGMSTHLLWQAGADCLRRWGLLDRLEATNCPAQRDILLDFGSLKLEGRPEPRDFGDIGAYAPRRIVLDGLLVQSAREAGATVLEGCHVRDLIRRDGRVVGLRYLDEGGAEREARSSIVIGADGVNSTVANAVEAREYDAHPKAQRTVFAYFADVDLRQIEFYSRPGAMAFAWRTNDDEVVAGFIRRVEDCDGAGTLDDRSFDAEMTAIAPGLAPRLRAARRVSRIRSGGVRGFLRVPCGPGWALVGDAGLNMDPISAQGISNALIQAEMLAEAVDTGLTGDDLDKRVKAYGAMRDSRFAPMHHFTAEMAKLDPAPPEEVSHLFVGLAQDQRDVDAYFGVFAQTVPVEEFFAPDNQARIMAKGRAAMAAMMAS